MLTFDFDKILKYYKGKALENVREIIPALKQSLEEEYWLPGVSRKAKSVFKKLDPSLISKKDATFLKEKEWNIYHSDEDGSDSDIDSTKKYYKVVGVIREGCMFYANYMDLILKAPRFEEEKRVFKFWREFQNDFLPLIRLIEMLDATRPKPVFTYLGVSRTATKTLTDIGLNLDLKTVRVCEVKYEKIQTKDGDWYWIAHLLWPKNTKHGRSRFATGGGDHCELCGHAIRNPFNWVPLLIDDIKGIPHSLWIGHDCARSVFGIERKGAIEYKGDK